MFIRHNTLNFSLNCLRRKYFQNHFINKKKQSFYFESIFLNKNRIDKKLIKKIFVFYVAIVS